MAFKMWDNCPEHLTLLLLLTCGVFIDIVSSVCSADTSEITGTGGTHESLNHPNLYENGQDCEWKITLTDATSTISLYIRKLNIDDKMIALACEDYLMITNGLSPYDTWLDKTCGNLTDVTVTGTTHSAIIKFSSDATGGQGEGWWIDWSSVVGSTIATTTSKPVDPNLIYYIIGGSVAGVSVLIAIIGTIIKLVKHEQRESRVRAQEDPTHITAEKALQQRQKESVPAVGGSLMSTPYTGAWQPGADIAPPPQSTTASSGANAKPAVAEVKRHIMISYQWDVKPEVLKFRERLGDAGYRVWIDVEQMHKGTSTFDSMAKAVDNAAVVIPVLTQKYQESINCRKEVEFADKKNKTLVPIRMETGYVTAAWLDFLLGGNAEFNFYDEDVYEEELKKIFQTIEALASSAKMEEN